MTKKNVLMCIVGLVLVTTGSTFADEVMPGGHIPGLVTNKEVVAAATFAVTAQEEAMQDKRIQKLPN